MVIRGDYMNLFESGHKACAGCSSALLIRHVLDVLGENTIVCQATGCMEVVSTQYPQSSWRVPYIHVTFENAAAVASGVARAMKIKRKDVNVLTLGGDGGMMDIGFQALSGAFERSVIVRGMLFSSFPGELQFRQFLLLFLLREQTASLLYGSQREQKVSFSLMQGASRVRITFLIRGKISAGTTFTR
jgi:hypothetical protein